MSETSTPRMTNPPPPDADEQDSAWGEILELEREFAAEATGEPAPKVFQTTEQMIAELGKVGLDASKFGLPSRTWTVEEAHEVLTQRGVTGDSFTLPGDKPKPIEQRWYPSKTK